MVCGKFKKGAMLKLCGFSMKFVGVLIACLYYYNALSECAEIIGIKKLVLPNDSKQILPPISYNLTSKKPLFSRHRRDDKEALSYSSNESNRSKNNQKQAFSSVVMELLAKESKLRTKETDISDESKEHETEKGGRLIKPKPKSVGTRKNKENEKIHVAIPIKLSFDDITTKMSEPIILEPKMSYILPQYDREWNPQEKERDIAQMREHMEATKKQTSSPKTEKKKKSKNPFTSMKAYFHRHNFFSNWGSKISNFFRRKKPKPKKSNEDFEGTPYSTYRNLPYYTPGRVNLYESYHGRYKREENRMIFN